MRRSIALFLFYMLITQTSFALDKGIGIVKFTREVNQSITLYADKNLKSKIVAEFIVEYAKGWAEYKIQTDLTDADNLLEYGYEKYGLPISALGSKNWVQVVYGFDIQNSPLTGWVNIEKSVSELVLWNTFLVTKNLYFESADKILLYDSKDGTLIDYNLEPSRYLVFNYIMKPIFAKENWMKVEIVTPEDVCDTPSSTRRKVVWIKYLNEKGRPLVWYFTRGC